MAKPMKPQTYDGTSDWPNYLTQFELVATYNGWDEDEKLAWLGNSLRGEAMSTLGRLDESDKESYSSLVHYLNLRFGTDAEVYQLLLERRVRNVDESLSQLANNIRTLVKRAYPTGREIWETLAVQHFKKAIPDYDTNFQISVSNPKTLDEALLIAYRVENFKISYKLQRNEEINGSMNQRLDSSNQTPFRAEVERIVVEKMEALLDNTSSEKQHGMGTPKSWSVENVTGRCSDKPHLIARVSPFIRSVRSRNSGRPTSSEVDDEYSATQVGEEFIVVNMVNKSVSKKSPAKQERGKSRLLKLKY